MFKSTVNKGMSFELQSERYYPLMYVNTDAFLSKQPALSEDALDKDDFATIGKLMQQVNRIKRQHVSHGSNIQQLLVVPKLENVEFKGKDLLEEPLVHTDLASSQNQFENIGQHSNMNNHSDCKQDEKELRLKDVYSAPINRGFAFSFDTVEPAEKSLPRKEHVAPRQMRQNKKWDKDSYKAPSQFTKTSLNEQEDLSICFQNTLASEELNYAEPKAKKGKKSKKTLSLRADVMNKNIFRALRRECKTMFTSFLKSNGMHDSKKKDIFLANLDQFSQYLLETSSVKSEEIRGFTQRDFSVYLGTFANYCAMKKIASRGEAKTKLDQVYSVLYNYSHVKFYEFICIPEIVALIKIICEKSGRENLLESNETLSANKQTYKDHIDGLMKTINGVHAN